MAEMMFGQVDHALDALEFVAAADSIRAVVSRANRYVEETAPWKLAKTDPDRLATVLYTLAETERLVAIAIQPFMPDTAQRMLDQLGVAGRTDTQWGGIPAGTRVTSQPTPLFPKIELPRSELGASTPG